MSLSARSTLKGKGRTVEAALDNDVVPVPSDSDSSSSSSDSNSDSDGHSSEEGDSDIEEISQEYLQSLLSKARENMRSKSTENEKLAFVEEEIRLDNEKSQPRGPPSLNPGKLPSTYFGFETEKKGGAPPVRDVDVERLERVSSSRAVPDTPTPPELAKDGRKLTKREKKEGKKKTAGPGWFDLPTPDAADLPRLYREVEALRMRNTLDPKRFYRKEEGEGKGIKGLPKHFAIGTIVPTSTPFGTASSDNLTRAERKRSIIDELVDDAEAKRYAKKKFTDLQTSRGAKGRRTLAMKNAARKPKW